MRKTYQRFESVHDSSIALVIDVDIERLMGGMLWEYKYSDETGSDAWLSIKDSCWWIFSYVADVLEWLGKHAQCTPQQFIDYLESIGYENVGL